MPKNRKIESLLYCSTKIKTLGEFDVSVNDISLVRAASGSKKIWKLYKFMLTHQNQSFTPESLIEHLWEQKEYSDPRGTLRRQMHRLREILNESTGDELNATILYANGYYRWNNQKAIDIDTRVFEQYVKKGDELFGESPVEALQMYKEAMTVYVGDYLNECVEQHWVFPTRNHYRRLFLRGVVQMINLMKSEEDYFGIIELCQKAIQIDVYEESFHLNLIEALLGSDEKRQALEHYEYISQFYEVELGLKPSIEMREIYKKILQAQNTIVSDDDLETLLGENIPLKNAFFCEPEVFKSIYELEQRRSERSANNFSICVLTVPNNRGESYAKKENRMNRVVRHMMYQLRKGDIMTRWNQQQLLLLLPEVDIVTMKMVVKRVLEMDDEYKSVIIDHMTDLVDEEEEHKVHS